MDCTSSGCSSGCGGHVIPCPCPETGNPEIDTLEKVVNCFWQKHQDLAVERDYYQSLESLTDAIHEAGLALGDENLGYDQPDNIPESVLAKVCLNLEQCEGNLAGCADFEEIYKVVDQTVGNFEGLTPALIYLTALRVGLQAGIHPEKIYLEAGARCGVEALTEVSTAQLVLTRDQLPRIFQHPELTSEDVQSCLTICKNQLRLLNAD